MTQADIIETLENNIGKKFTCKELSEILKSSGVGECLKKLRRHGDIFFKEIKEEGHRKFVYWL